MRADLQRPAAAVVVGVLVIVGEVLTYALAVYEAAFPEQAGPPTPVNEAYLSAVVQERLLYAVTSIALIAGVLLIRGARAGAPVFLAYAAAILALILIGTLHLSLALMDAVIIASAILALTWSTGSVEGPTPRLAVTAIASTVLGAAALSIGLGVVFSAAYAAMPVAYVMGVSAIGAIGLAAWVVGAAAFGFRWSAATIGWPLFAAGAIALAGSVALRFADDEAVADQFGLDAIVAAGARPDLGGAFAAIMILVGGALLRRQRRLEALQRAARRTSIEEAFR